MFFLVFQGGDSIGQLALCYRVFFTRLLATINNMHMELKFSYYLETHQIKFMEENQIHSEKRVTIIFFLFIVIFYNQIQL